MMIFLRSLAILTASFLVSFIVTPVIIRFSRRMGFVGRDVHKPGQPLVPELGGLGILLGIFAGAALYMAITLSFEAWVLVFVGCTAIAGAIGLWDYFVTMSGVKKTVLTTLACIPLVLGAILWPNDIVIGRPEVPFIGVMRLTLIYWILLPFAVAVPANAVNMMDTFNGVMPITSIFSVLGLLTSAVLLNRVEAMFMCLILLGSLLGFLPYNLYPSKVFASDVGSLAVGAAIGVIAVIGRLEIIGVTAMMPQIMNGFYILSSIKGLVERRKIKERPTIILGDNVLAANNSKMAPLTLANIILSKGPLREPELVNCYATLSFFSFMLSVLTAWLMVIT
ncbi:MAG: hypothetical protein QFX33_01505 [Candidatus Nezhaarchaeota archaeon]|nr:hypothetical protein [Candidatus Nezhaarchaeota archaeon]